MTREECINTLKGSMELMLFDATTGEMDIPENLNDLNRMTYEALKTAVELLEDSKWIPASEKLPAAETEVLICAIRKFRNGDKEKIITTAIYEDGNVSEIDSIWCWEVLDYDKWDEENDCGIINEGWWEYRHYNPDEVYNNVVDDKVIAWMPLPEAYEEN